MNIEELKETFRRHVEKYDMNASLFLITAWWSRYKYESPNLEIYSHGHDIHLDNYCKKGPRGYCLTKEELIEDFSLSIPLVDNNLAFCYPFYAYNDTIIDALYLDDYKIEIEHEFLRMIDFKRDVSIDEFVEMIKEEVKTLKEQLLRNRADLENFKRRTNEERIKERKYALQDILTELVEIIDLLKK